MPDVNLSIPHTHCVQGMGWYWQGPATVTTGALCPDHLRLAQLGVADTLRGRIVRLLFWLLR